MAEFYEWHWIICKLSNTRQVPTMQINKGKNLQARLHSCINFRFTLRGYHVSVVEFVITNTKDVYILQSHTCGCSGAESFGSNIAAIPTLGVQSFLPYNLAHVQARFALGQHRRRRLLVPGRLRRRGRHLGGPLCKHPRHALCLLLRCSEGLSLGRRQVG